MLFSEKFSVNSTLLHKRQRKLFKAQHIVQFVAKGPQQLIRTSRNLIFHWFINLIVVLIEIFGNKSEKKLNFLKITRKTTTRFLINKILDSAYIRAYPLIKLYPSYVLPKLKLKP